MSAVKPIEFSTEIYRLGMNFCVDVPLSLTNQSGTRSYARVRGTLNGCRFVATLTPRGQGRHRVFVNGALRKVARVGEGDVVRLVLAFDSLPEKASIPPDMMSALKEADIPLKTLQDQPPGRRREMLTWLSKAKRTETRDRRIRRIMDLLLKGPGTDRSHSDL